MFNMKRKSWKKNWYQSSNFIIMDSDAEWKWFEKEAKLFDAGIDFFPVNGRYYFETEEDKNLAILILPGIWKVL